MLRRRSLILAAPAVALSSGALALERAILANPDLARAGHNGGPPLDDWRPDVVKAVLPGLGLMLGAMAAQDAWPKEVAYTEIGDVTVPLLAGATGVIVELIGGGSRATNASGSWRGGGGGGYTKKTLTSLSGVSAIWLRVPPAYDLVSQVNAVARLNNSSGSLICTASTALEHSGGGGTGGDINRFGGTGDFGSPNAGGGGGAGRSGNGGDSVGAAPGASGGGPAGAGGSGVLGTAGNLYGGGGAAKDNAGLDGAQGWACLTWTKS